MCIGYDEIKRKHLGIFYKLIACLQYKFIK